MPILENAKHERFCQERALGKTQEEAYSLAGFEPSRQNAKRLANRDYIRLRVQELLVPSVERFEETAETLARQFDADREFAREHKNPGAAVAASVAKAKVLGLFIERAAVSVTHNYALMTEEELRFEIAALTAEARSIKPGVQ